MSHPDRRRKREKKREEMLKTRNEFDNRDLTPHNAVGTMINFEFSIKFR